MITVKITSSVSGTVKLSIYDMNGRLVLSDQSEKSIGIFERTLNISPLSAGMYTILVNIGNQKTMVTKFIKI
jgi:Secretion system C-terminal sorting domain